MRQAIFDDKDFDKLSFHDNFVHAMTFDPETGELLLDIDHLAKWISPEKEGHFLFAIAPSTLIFADIDDLQIDISVAGLRAFDIFEINREIEPTSEGVCVEIFNYEIVLDHVGEIRFSSTGFNMYLRNFFPEVDAMALSREERGGISFERVTYNT